MFILRRITSENKQVNDCLGDRYHLVLKETNKDDYVDALTEVKWKGDDDELYGFVIYSSGNEMIHSPLYKESIYFIMTESGKTFANITFKV
jgi:hypothetical protein